LATQALEAEEPQGELEAISFLGEPLFSSPPSGEAGERMNAQLAEALALHESDPRAIDGFVWYGRRLAYLGRYAEAIRVYSEGLALQSNEPHLLRHRGHRYITVRRIDNAISDLVRAAQAVAGSEDEVEPDGQPNEAGIPTSTLKTNIWYHLGLAYYLDWNFSAAADAFQRCFELARNDDMRVAAADWLYMSLRRDGRSEGVSSVIAFVTDDMELLENHAYYRRIRMYRGMESARSIESELRREDDALTLATVGYGIGNWYLVEGDTTRAIGMFEQIMDTGLWQAFGYIAAEADLARLTATGSD
jgi:tetratricopeptide (TPR) repeat protein